MTPNMMSPDEHPSPHTDLATIATLMRDEGVGIVPIVDEEGDRLRTTICTR